jgi:spermidine synthase / saccharopine dehydrogenase (NADP+, L-glutamate-forming)
MSHAKPYFITPAYAFVAYPNRDSTPFREFYRIPEAETVIRGTLRYQGFPEFIACLVKMGWLDGEAKEWLNDSLTWAEVSQKATGANSADEKYVSCVWHDMMLINYSRTLIDRITVLADFPSVSERNRILSGLRWIGLLSSEKVTPRGQNLLDTLCGRLESLMKYEEGERDLVMLQHKFTVERENGEEEIITSTLEMYGTPGGHSAMAVTVGVPCGIATQLVLDGVIKEPGVHAPYTKELCDPLIELLGKEGLGMVEAKV